MANYKELIREQNINRKRRNKTKGIKLADILTKERRKSYQSAPRANHIYDILRLY